MRRQRQRDVSTDPAPGGPLLVLSPHFDDAVLSCNALLARGEATDVVTVFGGDPVPPQQGWWDRRCGFASSAQSLPARRGEDDAAFAGWGHRRRSLAFVEAQYLSGPRPDDERAAILELVAEWVGRHPAGIVAVPAGAGRTGTRAAWRLAARAPKPFEFIRHDDHVFVRDAVLATKSKRTLLYEELPYLWTRRADGEVAATSTAWGFTPAPVVLSVDRAAKARRIGAYQSQLPFLTAGSRRPDNPGSLPATERYWWVRW